MTSTSSLQSISLYYREGSSDKVYHVQLREAEGGFVVDFQYGRRGSSLQAGTKTSSPVSRSQAEKVYAKLVAEKQSKGYTEGKSGTPYSGTAQEQQTSGYLPQLANFIDEDTALALLDDDRWAMQEKFDGVRQIVIRKGATISAANRKGLIVAISDVVASAVLSLQPTGGGDLVLDGESMGDTYVPFDILRFGRDLRMAVAKTRLELLDELMGLDVPGSLKNVRTAYTKEDKHRLYAELKTKGAEGVIFKRLDAAYVAGRPASGGVLLKFKFYTGATCKVIEINAKRSVRLGVAQSTGVGMLPIGNVTIPPNHSIPKVGELVEVRYLYAYPGGSLYQPTYRGVRTDLDVADDVSSLKLKSTTESEDE